MHVDIIQENNLTHTK